MDILQIVIQGLYNISSSMKILPFTFMGTSFSMLMSRGTVKYFPTIKTRESMRGLVRRNASFLKPSLILSMFMRTMLLRITKQFQIVWTIIKAISVYMMDYFGSFQVSTEFLLHNITMLQNASVTSAIRMFRNINEIIFRNTMAFRYPFIHSYMIQGRSR